MRKVAVVTGSESGLGAEIVCQLSALGYEVHGLDLKKGFDIVKPHRDFLQDPFGPVDVLVNNAGVNFTDWLPNQTGQDWDRVMDVNAKGIFMMVKTFLPNLIVARGTILNIVSNAARKAMRCSASYNASKGAAYMLTQQMARELAPDITVFSISPNKLEGTEMSRYIESRVEETRGWTADQAAKYQKDGILCGEETDPRTLAEFIGFLLSSKERHKYLAGCDLHYGY